jgi:hypothetical protein
MAKHRNFKTTALASAAFALQSFKGTRETDIAKPKKLTNQLYFNLISVCKRMWLLGMF